MLDAVLALNGLDTQVFGPVSVSASPDNAADWIIVPDAHLLFNGEFKRVGSTGLKITGEDGKSFFIENYFGGDKHKNLMSPEGAMLTADLVMALAGPLAPGQFAQAGAQPAAAAVIGRVEALTGSSTVIRNGVSVALNVGDLVRQGDVVQTSGGSTVALVLTDGSTFNMSANARMVLSDFVYNQGGANNSAAISLVQGGFSFIAGQVAKTGNMQVNTPVATMGIRGTAVSVEISAVDGATNFSVMAEPTGTGSFTLSRITRDPATGQVISTTVIGTVNNSAVGWIVRPAGPNDVTVQQVSKTAPELQRELAIVQSLFSTLSGYQANPISPQQLQPDPQQQQQQQSPNPEQRGSLGTPGTTTVVVDNKTYTVTQTEVKTSTGDGSTGVGPNTPPVDGGIKVVVPVPDPVITPAPVPPPLPPLPHIIVGDGVNPIILGTPGNDQIYGTNISEIITGDDGDDDVFASGGNDTIIAAHGGGNDFYDGDEGFDTVKYESTTRGVVFHLDVAEFTLNDGSKVKLSTATGADIGIDQFIRMEKVVGSPGNDTFHIYDLADWEIDGGDGVDIVRIEGDLDLTAPFGGPYAYNVEVLDLNREFHNAVNFSPVDVWTAVGIDGVPIFEGEGPHATPTFRVIGGGTGDLSDTVNLSNIYQLGIEGPYHYGQWRTAGTFQDTAQDDAEGDPFNDHATDGVDFVIYEFVENDQVLAQLYIQDGITVTGLNKDPNSSGGTTTGSVSAGNSTITSTGAGYLIAGHNLIDGLGSVNGLNGDRGFGENGLDRNDDGSTIALNITSVFGENGINFFGHNYTSVYINNNGNITFASASGTFTPSQIGGQGNPIIAPFWADVDTRGGVVAPTTGGNSTGSNMVYWDLDAQARVFTVTWDDVGYYSSQTNRLNAFQLQLIDRGNGDFDIVFRYEDVNWTTGSASGGSGGLGGTPARAGYSAGDGNSAHYFELPGSGNQTSMLDLESNNGNTGTPGVYVFHVRNGAVSEGTANGSFTFDDADALDTHTVSSAFNAAASGRPSALGVLTAVLARDSTGAGDGLVNWHYDINPQTLASLAPGSTLTEIFDVVVSDGHGGTVIRPITVTVSGPEAPVNHAPVLHEAASPRLDSVAPGAAAPGVGSGTLLRDLVDFASNEAGHNNVSDVDANAQTGIAIFINNRAHGDLYYSTNGGNTWTLVGSVSDGSALLLAANDQTRLYFQPSLGFEGTIDDVFTFRAWDQTAGINGQHFNIGAGGANTNSVSSAPDHVGIDVVPPEVTLTVLTASGFGAGGFYEVLLNADLSEAPTSSRLVLHHSQLDIDVFVTAENLQWSFDNPGNEFRMTGGTLTGIEFEGYARFTGFHIPAVQMMAAMEQNWASQGEDTSLLDAIFDSFRYNATGGEGADELFGTHHGNVIDGRGGNDLISGGFRNDVFTGGSGHDTFVFEKSNGQPQHDVITDMTLGHFENPNADSILLLGITPITIEDIIENGDGDIRIVIDGNQTIDLAGVSYNPTNANLLLQCNVQYPLGAA